MQCWYRVLNVTCNWNEIERKETLTRSPACLISSEEKTENYSNKLRKLPMCIQTKGGNLK